MMLAAPELVEAERVDLFDEIEVAAELQHRMLADRMMRGEEGSELEARHGVSLRIYCSSKDLDAKLRGGAGQRNPASPQPAHGCRAKAGNLPSSGIGRAGGKRHHMKLAKPRI